MTFKYGIHMICFLFVFLQMMVLHIGTNTYRVVCYNYDLALMWEIHLTSKTYSKIKIEKSQGHFCILYITTNGKYSFEMHWNIAGLQVNMH